MSESPWGPRDMVLRMWSLPCALDILLSWVHLVAHLPPAAGLLGLMPGVPDASRNRQAFSAGEGIELVQHRSDVQVAMACAQLGWGGWSPRSTGCCRGPTPVGSGPHRTKAVDLADSKACLGQPRGPPAVRVTLCPLPRSVCVTQYRRIPLTSLPVQVLGQTSPEPPST